jgi:hypothetical protein
MCGGAEGLLTRGSPLRHLPGPKASGFSAEKQLPLQRRDRPGFAPGSLTACRWGRPYHGPMPASRALSLWLPVVVWAAFIFTLSSIPHLGTGFGFWDTVLRKGAHLSEFAVLGALLLRALPREAPALIAGILYAASDELHQHFVGGRHASPLDVLLDSAGVALGVYLFRRALQTRLVPGTGHGR